ncbi:MAG TPA: hypothetical protein VIC26_03905 [Marinagarivorans sp.]
MTHGAKAEKKTAPKEATKDDCFTGNAGKHLPVKGVSVTGLAALFGEATPTWEIGEVLHFAK